MPERKEESALGTAARAGLRDTEAANDHVAGAKPNATDGAPLSGARRPEGRFQGRTEPSFEAPSCAGRSSSETSWGG